MIELIIALLIICISIFLLVIIIKSIFSPLKFQYKTFFLSGYINHNNITKIKRGNCILKFIDKTLKIEQNNEVIEDNCSDIYNMRIWQYKGGLYLAINMKTHSEYKFSLMEPNEDKSADLAKVLIYKMFKGLSNRLKVELIDCGESTDSDDDNDEE